MRNGVTVHSEKVVDSADARALTEEGKFRLRDLTHLAHVHAWPGMTSAFAKSGSVTQRRPHTATPTVTFLRARKRTSRILQSGGAVSRRETQ